jgi:hypothetical protein
MPAETPIHPQLGPVELSEPGSVLGVLGAGASFGPFRCYKSLAPLRVCGWIGLDPGEGVRLRAKNVGGARSFENGIRGYKMSALPEGRARVK